MRPHVCTDNTHMPAELPILLQPGGSSAVFIGGKEFGEDLRNKQINMPVMSN